MGHVFCVRLCKLCAFCSFTLSFPRTFWSYEKLLELIDRKVLLPPLSLVTVAAILPQTWEFKLVDRNVRSVSDAEWNWAELVIVSAMIVQKEDMLDQIREAKRRHKSVAVGGPYPTSIPHEPAEAGQDYLIWMRAKSPCRCLSLALEQGETHGTFRSGGEKPDITGTPIPRFDLLDLTAYDAMSVQFSRGCPFQCEFCDIIVLYGRKPRTKTPEQLLAELDYLYDLGWRRPVFMVDDTSSAISATSNCFLKNSKFGKNPISSRFGLAPRLRSIWGKMPSCWN